MNKEHVNLTATQRLMELLASINHEISYKIIECVKYHWKSPISFLDFGDTNDTISFVNSPKVWELMDRCGEDYKTQAWISNRSSIKIGKAIKMIYGDSFPINQPKGTIAPKPPVDIESFVNMFKMERDKNKNYERFELVKGKDIRFWYNQKNYSRFIQEDTTLAKSCLRYEESGKFLEMYVNNPDLVNMLILKDDVDKLRGRALIWYLTYPENRIYMERIYTINDSDVELYKKYAREQGWLYKSRQTYGYQHNIVDGKTNEEYYWENFPMRVQLKRKPIHYYPYLDTLSVYNPETVVISNEGRLLRRPPYLRLSDHQGSFIDEADHREMVYSQHYHDEIPREEAEFVGLDQDWVFQQDVVYVHNSGGLKSHRNSPLVCESYIIGNRKYFLKDSCVWSDYLKTFIYKDSVRDGFLDVNKTKRVMIHRRMVGKYFEADKDGYLIKKKIDASMPFEEYLAQKGMTMKSKRSQLEKLYKEWDFNRTINWNEPDGDTDTEEVTPRGNTVRRSLISSNPWDNDFSYPTPRPSTPQVRRGSSGSLTDRLRATVSTNMEDPISDFITAATDALTQNSGVPISRFRPNFMTEPPQSDQVIGRVDRSEPRNEPTREEPSNVIRVVRNVGPSNQPITFTVTPVSEERPISDEPMVDMSPNSVFLDSLGHIDSPDTSANGTDPEDTTDDATPRTRWTDSSMRWSVQSNNMTWGFHSPWTVSGSQDNDNQ